jgi:uncharacterized membrane protein YfcA
VDGLATVAIGFVSGVLSGMFGIGGGIVSTPAIRLLLDAPALVAVGTPLVAILPSAITGSRAYMKRGLADVRSGVILGIAGSATAILGAWLASLVGGQLVLILTAALILYVAVDMVLQIVRPPRIGLAAAEEADAASPPSPTSSPPNTHPRMLRLVALGAMTGLYSGFLGLGGGFVLVPMLSRWLRFPLKTAIGTSLTALSILSVPGIITHAALGHVDWLMAAGLTVGVVPGAFVGARITLGASDRSVRIAFASMLALVGVWLAVSELPGLGV